jgi:outer membrane protein assembly factor BamB
MSRKRNPDQELVYKPPQGWPLEPPAWMPKGQPIPQGLQPDPTLPAAPDGWTFWEPASPHRALLNRCWDRAVHVVLSANIYVKAAAGAIGLIATVGGTVIAFQGRPAVYSATDWSTQANALCEEDYSQQNVPMLQSILALQSVVAADQRSQTASDQAIVGIASSAGAFRKLIGDLRGLRVPGGDSGEVSQLLSRGETVFGYLNTADADIENGLNPTASGSTQSEPLLNAVSTLEQLNTKALPPWRRSLKSLGLAQCPYLSTGVSTLPVVASSRPRWTFDTGDSVESSPAVADGSVYVGSDNGQVYALDAATGHSRWSYRTGSAVWSSPAVASGTVYTGSNNGTVYALSAATGKLRWSYPTGKVVDSSPAVAGTMVYVGSDNGRVYALDAATGHPAWSFATGGAVDSSPAVSGHVVYIGSNNGTVYALDARTGHRIWSFATGSDVWSRPAIVGAAVYISSRDDRVYALDAATGHLRWSFATAAAIYSSPVAASGSIYVGSRDDKLYALDASTGHLRWSFTTRSTVDSTPAVADGTVYAGGNDHTVYAFDAATGHERSAYATRGIVFSSPAVAGNTVYVGSGDGLVYALSASAAS